MKIVAILLQVSGWFIVLASLVLLHVPVQRSLFIAAGLCVEILGLSLLAAAYARSPRSAQ